MRTRWLMLLLVVCMAACSGGDVVPAGPTDSAVPEMVAESSGRVLASARPGFSQLYYEGTIVRTVVPPAAAPKQGRDNLYAISGGVGEQLAVIAVAPGDRDYHGGQWAYHSVTWTVSGYLLTSEGDVLAAEAAGHVTITRVEDNDFKCPVQP